MRYKRRKSNETERISKESRAERNRNRNHSPCSPSDRRGGVKSNSRFNKSVGNKNIGNNGDGTVTGIIGNQALQTTSQSLSGAVNEILSTAETSIKNSFNGCSLAYQNEHFAVSYIKDNVTVETKTIGVCKITLNTNAGNQSSVSEISCQVKSRQSNPYAIELENPADNALLTPTRTGYTFAGWFDGNGRELSVDSLMNGKIFFAQWNDVTAPTFTINATTGGIASNGTLSFANVVEKESGIAGYYIGQTKPNATGSNVSFDGTTSVTVNSSGVWYMAIKDKVGNMSEVQTATFYSLTLNADGATNYTSNSAFIKSGTTVALPTGLTKAGYKADTWTGGISSITVSGNVSLSPSWYVPPVGVIRNAPLGYRDDFYWTNTTGRTVTVTYLIQLYGTESDYCYCSIYVGPGTDDSQPVVFNECGNRYYNGSFNVPNGYILHVSNQKDIKCTILQLTGN